MYGRETGDNPSDMKHGDIEAVQQELFSTNVYDKVLQAVSSMGNVVNNPQNNFPNALKNILLRADMQIGTLEDPLDEDSSLEDELDLTALLNEKTALNQFPVLENIETLEDIYQIAKQSCVEYKNAPGSDETSAEVLHKFFNDLTQELANYKANYPHSANPQNPLTVDDVDDVLARDAFDSEVIGESKRTLSEFSTQFTQFMSHMFDDAQDIFTHAQQQLQALGENLDDKSTEENLHALKTIHTTLQTKCEEYKASYTQANADHPHLISADLAVFNSLTSQLLDKLQQPLAAFEAEHTAREENSVAADSNINPDESNWRERFNSDALSSTRTTIQRFVDDNRRTISPLFKQMLRRADRHLTLLNQPMDEYVNARETFSEHSFSGLEDFLIYDDDSDTEDIAFDDPRNYRIEIASSRGQREEKVYYDNDDDRHSEDFSDIDEQQEPDSVYDDADDEFDDAASYASSANSYHSGDEAYIIDEAKEVKISQPEAKIAANRTAFEFPNAGLDSDSEPESVSGFDLESAGNFGHFEDNSPSFDAVNIRQGTLSSELSIEDNIQFIESTLSSMRACVNLDSHLPSPQVLNNTFLLFNRLEGQLANFRNDYRASLQMADVDAPNNDVDASLAQEAKQDTRRGQPSLRSETLNSMRQSSPPAGDDVANDMDSPTPPESPRL